MLNATHPIALNIVIIAVGLSFIASIEANITGTCSKKDPETGKCPATTPKRLINTKEHSPSVVILSCSKDGENLDRSPMIIPLPSITDDDEKIMSKKNRNMFFVETSGKNYLTPKDTCAIESAVANSGFRGRIVITMTTKNLNLNANNATCHLYREYSGRDVFFRHVDLNEIFVGTPLQRLHESGQINNTNSKYQIIQYSDMLRIALVHRYGGFYSDLDMVFLKSVDDMYNVVGADDLTFSNYDNPHYKYNFGSKISNAIFHNDAGHAFLATVMKVIPLTFSSGSWGSGGPTAFQHALDILCGHDNKIIRPLNPKDHSRKNCQGMALLEPRTFYPVDWFYAGTLFEKRTEEEWQKLFQFSRVVHFYGSSGRHQKVMRPKNYGHTKPAYAMLGPKYCPMSFFSTRPF